MKKLKFGGKILANIWFTSDLHFCHDKEFVWKARGFNNVEEMNQAIVERFNSKVAPEDTLYILGDAMMGDNAEAEQYLAQLNGIKIFIRGNHDTNPRVEIYKKYTDEEIKYADMIKHKKKTFYLSHFPTITANTGEAHNQILNLFGHTHQTHNFNVNSIYMYHVGVDSHDCYPVHIDDIIATFKEWIQKTKELAETIKEIKGEFNNEN